MTAKNTAILVLSAAVLSAGVTRYYFPQVQTKTVEVAKETVRTDVQTVIKTVKEPNGQESTTTTIIDHSVKHDTDTKVAITTAPNNWVVSISAQENFKFTDPVYGLQVQRRILGPIFVGATGSTKGDIGVSLGMEF